MYYIRNNRRRAVEILETSVVVRFFVLKTLVFRTNFSSQNVILELVVEVQTIDVQTIVIGERLIESVSLNIARNQRNSDVTTSILRNIM